MPLRRFRRQWMNIDWFTFSKCIIWSVTRVRKRTSSWGFAVRIIILLLLFFYIEVVMREEKFIKDLLLLIYNFTLHGGLTSSAENIAPRTFKGAYQFQMWNFGSRWQRYGGFLDFASVSPWSLCSRFLYEAVEVRIALERTILGRHTGYRWHFLPLLK